MKPVIIFFLLLVGNYLNATTIVGSSATALTLYEQLCDLNKYWCAHPSTDPYMAQPAEFADHEKLIRLHLATVENTLRRTPTPQLSEQQHNNRLHCLDILHDYWTTGVFPKNIYHSYTLPYFIDRYNTACAVGHLIRETGYEAVANCIAQEMNYAYIEQMPYNEIDQWAAAMGFSVEELKWIQPSYAPPFTIQTTSTNADCGENNGSLQASFIAITGPVTPESIRWYKIDHDLTSMVGQTTTINNAKSGLYKIAATTVGTMYPYIQQIGVLSDNDGPQVTATIQNETCYYEQDGRIEIAISGGVEPYEIIWYKANGQIIATNTTIIENLRGSYIEEMQVSFAMPYYVGIKDANGCQTYKVYEVSTQNINSVTGWPSVIQQPTCNSSDGIIQVLYYEPGSTFAWSHDPALTSDIATNLPAGFYSTTITNAAGCSQVAQTTLSNAAFPSNFSNYFSVSSNIYCGQGIASIQCPIGNYTYNWSHDPNLNTSLADSLPVGDYKVTITNSNGCQFLYRHSIGFLVDVYVPILSTIVNANSSTGVLGSIDLGYQYGYQYTWSHNAAIDTSFVNNLSSGIYTVTISSVNNCSIVINLEVLDESPLANVTNPNTYNPINLSITQIGTELTVNYTTSQPISNPTFVLYDITGHKIQQVMAAENGKPTQISANNLPSGIYLIELHSKEARKCVKFWLANN